MFKKIQALILALALALAAWPAQAIDYNLPGPTLPPGCSGSGGSYTCGALTFAAGDTLTVAQAATVTVNGALVLGASALINANGLISNLSFNVSGAINTGASSVLNASVTSSAAVNIAAGSIVGGNINTLNGAVTLGASDQIGGTISVSQTGAITVGASTSISGGLNTDTGAIIIAAGSAIAGSVASHVTGDIAIGANTTINGGLSTATGGITLGAGAVVNGPIASTVQGGVTLGANAQAGSSISTASGGISLGADSIVGNLVSTTGAGAIALADGSSVNSVYCYATHDQSCVSNNSGKSMPPPSPPSAPASAAAGAAASAFECLETGSNTPWSAVARKPLFTKLAGASFSFDIAALNTDGSLAGNYAPSGGSAKYVRVELFDDSTPAATCPAYANAVATQTVTFTPGAASGTAGRTASAASGTAGRTASASFNLGSAFKVLRCRVTECSNSSCASFSALAPSCSSDQFSVRPPAPILNTSAFAPAPSSTATPALKAGANFSLNATTTNGNNGAGSNYGAVLQLDQSKLSAQISSQDSSLQSGGVVGVLIPTSLAANAASINAAYDEVGYLYLAPGAYRDDVFTLVDSSSGDCISDTSSSAYLSDTLVAGKYGCSIGNQLGVSLGRFMPDHFDTAIDAGVPMSCPGALNCAGAGVVYAAQPFGVTLTARSLASATTLNYGGVFSHAVTLQAWDGPGSTALQNPPAKPGGSVLTLHDVTAASFVAGVADVNGLASPAYAFPFAWPTASSNLAAPTAVYLRALETGGADGVTSMRGSASIEGGVTVVAGRLLLANNLGSELLPLPVNVYAQFWNLTRFMNSTSDNASTFNASDVVLSNCSGHLNLGSGACISTLGVAAAPSSLVLVGGATRFRLNAPGPGNTGRVDLNIGVVPWLPGATARIAVGLYKNGPLIYVREMY